MASSTIFQDIDLTTLNRKHYAILATFMKSNPKVSSLAPTTIDPANIQEFFVKFQIMISTIPALEIVLNYLPPTNDDRPFQRRFKTLLEAKNREKLDTFCETFENAKLGFLLAQNILVAYLLLCAGSNKPMCRTIMKYPSNPELALNELANDYRKTSANNAITLKSELLNSTIVTNCEEMIEEMESKRTMILEMGRAIDDSEMADVALKAAKDHPRYQIDKPFILLNYTVREMKRSGDQSKRTSRDLIAPLLTLTPQEKLWLSEPSPRRRENLGRAPLSIKPLLQPSWRSSAKIVLLYSHHSAVEVVAETEAKEATLSTAEEVPIGTPAEAVASDAEVATAEALVVASTTTSALFSLSFKATVTAAVSSVIARPIVGAPPNLSTVDSSSSSLEVSNSRIRNSFSSRTKLLLSSKAMPTSRSISVTLSIAVIMSTS